ncbi:YunG family protein [Metabacillus iocasae]|uniref:Isopentenyldiphosphate isomerase n=1 Tax=Priestia iocasae TaxID=2291674 RepID=A0ABS2R001_9BACI|nr:isopentenyldiphosphate isomerase [Metabacillus iocasae]
MSEQEMLKIFDKHHVEQGIATREDVHKKGYWHEAFHCWFVGEVNGELSIYLQIRSSLKKDYPNLLDITAAGHLLADETIEDGVREVHEELGIQVTMQELVPLGIISYSVAKGAFLDNEFAHVYLYKNAPNFDLFHLQEEEVSGMVRMSLKDFTEMWLGERTTLYGEGFEVMEGDKHVFYNRIIHKKKFVQHVPAYYETVIKRIEIERMKELLLKGWSLQSSSKWTADNPACGQCSVTSLVMQDVFGGIILKTRCEDGWHFYNQIDGMRYDFTASQFSSTINYDDIVSSREEAFQDTNHQQYEYLLKKLR